MIPSEIEGLIFNPQDKYLIIETNSVPKVDQLAEFLSMMHERYNYEVMHVEGELVYLEKIAFTPGTGALNVEAPGG